MANSSDCKNLDVSKMCLRKGVTFIKLFVSIEINDRLGTGSLYEELQGQSNKPQIVKLLDVVIYAKMVGA